MTEHVNPIPELFEVGMELNRQHEKWGEQNHPDGTGSPHYRYKAGVLRRECDEAAADGDVTWLHILREEVYEAFAERDEEALLTELNEVAAVAVQWRMAIRRRQERRRARSEQETVLGIPLETDDSVPRDEVQFRDAEGTVLGRIHLDDEQHDKDRGLYAKYQVNRLHDPEGKHTKCRYFVLDPAHDVHARRALYAYAESCRKDYPKLADDCEQLAVSARVDAYLGESVSPPKSNPSESIQELGTFVNQLEAPDEPGPGYWEVGDY